MPEVQVALPLATYSSAWCFYRQSSSRVEWAGDGRVRVRSRQVGLQHLAGVAQNKGEEGNDSRTRGLVSWLSELYLICSSGVGITEGAAACAWGQGEHPQLVDSSGIIQQEDQTVSSTLHQGTVHERRNCTGF